GPGRLTRRPAGLPTDSSLRSASVVNGATEIKIKSQSQSQSQSQIKRLLTSSAVKEVEATPRTLQ
ncbi:hypothetical protein ACJ6YK_32185, partial [Pseudomonas marginalis]